MNALTSRWTHLKENLAVFLFLSLLQTWLNFNFPAPLYFAGLTVPMGRGVVSLLSIICTMYVFAFPENFSRLVTLEFFDHLPNAQAWKTLFRWVMVGMVHLIFFCFWYINFHQVPTNWYIIWYLNSVIVFALMYQVVEKYTHSQC